MSRVQLALRVADLEASVAFYAKLFGTEPAKRRPGYANFAIADPPLKLVLIEGQPGEPTRMDHLGVEVQTTEEVTACCYAVQDKVWVTGPARNPGRSTWLRAMPRSSTRPPTPPAASSVQRDGRRIGSAQAGAAAGLRPTPP